jgi:RNA polymerase sigma factor (sigma-70 family)
MVDQAADEHPSDADVVHAARGGDGSALSTLLDRHRTGLYSHALHFLSRREDAADAVQETFVLALARLDQLRDADAAGAWLRAILRSVCLMQVRRPRREIATADIEVFAERAEETIGGSPLQDWVFAALEGLPEPLRLATLLRYFGRGHSYAQIALLCDVPVGTVRSRLHQAKVELGSSCCTRHSVGREPAPNGRVAWR